MKIKRRFLSLLLAICLVAGLVPATVFAAEPESFVTSANANHWGRSDLRAYLNNAAKMDGTLPLDTMSADNGAKYVDVSRDVSAKISHCRVSCLKMLLPILVLLFGLLAFIYKPKTAAKIIIPSVVAALFAIGLVTITGSEINLFHVLAIFLIIGFGLDYSVFRASGIKSSADAVLLSCMTSIFSFLLLACTSFKLISSLGFILSVGLAVSYMTSLLFNYDEENLS